MSSALQIFANNAAKKLIQPLTYVVDKSMERFFFLKVFGVNKITMTQF